MRPFRSGWPVVALLLLLVLAASLNGCAVEDPRAAAAHDGGSVHHLTCGGDTRRALLTFDEFVPHPYPDAQAAVASFADSDAGERTETGPETGDTMSVFILRSDGTARAQVDLLRASTMGWYRSTAAWCPRERLIPLPAKQ